MTTEILLLIFSFLLLLGIGLPVGWSIGLSSLFTLLLSMDSLPAVTTMAQRMATGIDSFALLAIPFFILAGQIMNHGGIAKRMIAFARSLVGAMPGGLAHVNIIAAMLFGAISGSAAAAASAMGSMLSKEMKEEGYSKEFGAAVNITSSTTGLVIPPSNILIVYSLASGGVSIAALFLAGYIPGILTGLALMMAATVYAIRKRYPTGRRTNLKTIINTFWRAFPSLFLLVVVIGGIVAGIFTATEASGIAVIYTIVLSWFYKELTITKIRLIMLESVKTTAVVMLLVATSMGLSWVMSYADIPQTVSNNLLTLTENPVIILLIINLILLAVGVFMDMTPAVLIFTPIFLPVAESIGMDPIHFGIMMVLNLCIGLCTPPVGTVLFIGVGVANTSIEKVLKPLIPLFIVMLMVLLLVAYIPGLSLWLPGLIN